MRLLMLGGTEFVGRAVVEAARARGWQVTVFNRGRRGPLPEVTALRGDRTAPGGLAALEHGTWDVVVDTWDRAPSAVRDAARLLADRVRHYTYVSTRSVYAYPAPAGQAEDGPLVDVSPDSVDDTDYARAKRGGELAALSVFGDHALLARAGLILGPYEDVGRLPWWLTRIARGGPVLAPGPRDLPLQYVDARDLATWLLDAAERGLGGPYNLVSPPGHTTMGELLETCVRATDSSADLRWTTPERILAADIAPWTDLPIWLPPGELYDTLHAADVSKAVAAGLRCRPVGETVTDTWAWLRGSDGPAPWAVGLSPEKEAEVLAAQRQRE
ncbi:NAD-dependent epimerase/dehydratase family protein [Streptomyces sp. NPDC059850]|uniref:NAD-dependent epimerase/dehydratase family protein n=1 Tax=Streptomyces sp. NPDC059850 TaxID=3346970 RepID=UPI00364B88D2